MRTRKEIENVIETMVGVCKGTKNHIQAGNTALILEVLLDIRDILSNPRNENAAEPAYLNLPHHP